ncbi:ribosome biosynthesis protein rrb1 [Tulasnella sp. 403]|nr:ribosome biosynthesis protein rrb1 [Tulasnella sp. 403]
MKRLADDKDMIEVDGQATAKSRAVDGKPASRRETKDDPRGAFEDEWEDEIEEEEVDNEHEESERGEDAMDVDTIQEADEDEFTASAPKEATESVFIPGVHALGEDEVLEADQSAYEMLHQMSSEWPCLSFDILRDNLGENRHEYPATAYIVSGTQAEKAHRNEVLVMKMSQLHKTQKDDDDSDDDDDEDDDIEDDGILEYRSIPHQGGVNRIRAQPLPAKSQLPPPDQPYHVATWSETGKVHIWNVRQLIEALAEPGYTADSARWNSPVYTIASHGRAEGFAMDWSPPGPSTSLRILTGDIHSKIYLSTATTAGFNTAPQPFASHTSSVEDIQWSPQESTVFASCSADQSVRVWDIRVKSRKNVVSIPKAHDSDVNVISWNKGTTYLLASGGDEGGIKIWDLRNLKKGSSTPASASVASFNWHTGPITSIEWHPSEDSILAASGADDQVTLWDLSVEHDEDAIRASHGDKVKEVPPQLLFLHQGQKDVKELHWHPQIPGCVITTAQDGFNVFKTISV